jgi:hypothetical protein
VQQIERCVGNFVGLLLDRFDGMHTVLEIVEVGHQRDHLLATSNAQLSVLDEILKKPIFSRHQSPEHLALLLPADTNN